MLKDHDMSVKDELIDQLQDDGQGDDSTVANEQKQDKKKKGLGRSRKKNADKEKIEELSAEVSELKDKYLRLHAEFDNYKKRTIREKLDMMSTAARDTLSALLPVLDDFDRAKKIADDENTNESFSEGVSMVYNKLFNTLYANGLKKMETAGEDFDPELHEAITEIPAPTEELKGKVIDTIETGYYLNDKIIRHAKVVIGK